MSNDMNMMTSMAISKATQADFGINQSKAKSLSNEQDALKKEQELRKASQGFEAIFIQKMWEEMRASMPENSMHGSKEEEYWQSMYSQRLGENMASNGGIGLADMMMEQLSRDRVKSPSAQNIFDRTPMSVSPAPLLNESARPAIETKQVANNTSRALQNPSQNVNDLYQDMEIGSESNKMGFALPNVTPMAGTPNSELNTNSQNMGEGHSYYAESYKEASLNADANSRTGVNFPVTGNISANARAEMNATQQVSPVLRQTLDDLQNLVEPKKLEPTIVRTTYTSNLPASERKNALLDRNGKISAKHLASLQPIESEQNSRSAKLGNSSRTLSNEEITNQDLNPYPINLLPENANQTAAKDNTKSQEDVLNVNRDILAGIGIRYVSNTPPRALFTSAELEEASSRLVSNSHNASGNMTANMSGKASVFPTYAEVQAELDTLLSRDSKSNNYGAMLASSTQINTSNTSSSMGMNGGMNGVNNTHRLANLNMTSNTAKFLNNDSSIPVFRTMPSLDEALQAGTLIASLSPEEIRATQSGNRTTSVMPILTAKKANQEKLNSDALGGPQISQPASVLPHNKISGISPKLDMQSPLENGEIRSSFGWRLDPFSNQRAWHTGLDIQASAGSAVNAAHDGVVSFVGKDAELGNMIIVEHGNGMQSIYGHNAELLVKEGEKISAGTNIAKVGMSGRAAGAHLHFEIRHNGLPINPEPYLSRNRA